MSDVKRLGADPLAWIASGGNAGNASGKTEPAPPVAPGQAGGASPAATAKAAGGALADLEVRREDKEHKAKLEKRLATEQACAALEALLAGLRAGRLDVGREPGVWRLPVGASVDLELKIAAKKDKARCTLSLEWKID
jgi:amphi-Trp domain-containing protein